MIEDAFRQPLEIIRPHVNAFVQALIAVLHKNRAVQTDDEHAHSLNDSIFELGSRHFSYLF